MDLRIGCSGWFYWHWKGRFYPEELPTSEWFAHYRRRFNTVELNAPFYSWPKPPSVRRWKKQATRTFKYCVKVNGSITHDRRFVGTTHLVRDFCRVTSEVEPHMGCLLFQCPPSYHFTSARLRNLVRQAALPKNAAVEFRHRSWWNEETYSAFRQEGIIFCSVSGPRLPDELIQIAPDVYVRFHGKKGWYRYDYSKGELEVWAKRIVSCAARTAWIYFNNDFGANAPRNARALRTMLKRQLAAGIAQPVELR